MKTKERKIKILLVVSQLEIGGLELQVLELCRGLSKNHYEIYICSIWPRMSLAEEFRQEGVEIIPIHKRRKIDFSIIFELRNFLIRNEIDIIHTWIFTANTWGRIAGILAKIPIIIGAERGVDIYKPTINKIIDHILAKFSDVMIGNSQAVKEFMVDRQNIPASKCKVIYNGVQISRFQANHSDKDKSRVSFSLPTSKLIVGTVANFTKAKDYPNFIFAAALVLRNFPSVHFVACGHGASEKEARDLTKDLGIDENITFLGKQTNIPQVLIALDVFVMASVSEGFSNAILEAMSSGLPVVVTDVGGAREVVVNGVTGNIVPPRNPEALAEKIGVLLELSSKRTKMGIKALEAIRNKFSMETMIDTYDSLYRGLFQETCSI